MREIDVAHQSEDQRESAGDEKIQPAQGNAVEQRVEKDPLPADEVLQLLRPGRKDQPERQHRDDQDQQRPDGMAFDKTAHRSSPATLARAKRARAISPRAGRGKKDAATAPFICNCSTMTAPVLPKPSRLAGAIAAASSSTAHSSVPRLGCGRANRRCSEAASCARSPHGT